MDTKSTHPAILKFPGSAKDGKAELIRLAADSITANNEPELPEPQVKLKSETISDFKPGTTISLPKHSMTVVTWQQAEN